MPRPRSTSEPPTIYECPVKGCGLIADPRRWTTSALSPRCSGSVKTGLHAPAQFVPVRVIREDAIDSDEVIDALIVRVWEDPPEAFGDTEREDLRAALRAAFGLAAEGQEEAPSDGR